MILHLSAARQNPAQSQPKADSPEIDLFLYIRHKGGDSPFRKALTSSKSTPIASSDGGGERRLEQPPVSHSSSPLRVLVAKPELRAQSLAEHKQHCLTMKCFHILVFIRAFISWVFMKSISDCHCHGS